MATVEVVSATTAFHEQKVDQEPKKTEEAAAEVEEVVAVARATPTSEDAKETDVITTDPADIVLDEPVVPDKSEASPVLAGIKATAEEAVEEVKIESRPEEPPAAAAAEEEKTKEVVADDQPTAVENPSDAPEPEADDVEAKPEAEDVDTAAVTDEEEKAKEVDGSKVDTSAAAVAEVEETKKGEE